jgi:uncharacterized protein YbjT (DUF2867 family)
MSNVLVTGATGYVGGKLLARLLDGDDRHEVRCMVRDPARARPDARASIVRGDVLDPASLPGALDGVEVAYYLVHSMGRGNGDFAQRDRRGAEAFAQAARGAGVRRVVYLGGLGGGERAAASEHLRSREEVARVLAGAADSVVHVRAAMVIGARSASFLMLRKLVERLPAMICPRWIDTRTQPVAIRDVVGALAALARPDEPAPAEVQIGGADVLSYREMMSRFAVQAGRRAPLIVRVPVLTPRLSSYWVSLVTQVDPGLARPLVQGLGAEMVVREPPPPGLNDSPLGFEAAVREALAAGG